MSTDANATGTVAEAGPLPVPKPLSRDQIQNLAGEIYRDEVVFVETVVDEDAKLLPMVFLSLIAVFGHPDAKTHLQAVTYFGRYKEGISGVNGYPMFGTAYGVLREDARTALRIAIRAREASHDILHEGRGCKAEDHDSQ